VGAREKLVETKSIFKNIQTHGTMPYGQAASPEQVDQSHFSGHMGILFLMKRSSLMAL